MYHATKQLDRNWSGSSKSIEFIEKKYDNFHIENYVIMPNHIHLLVLIDGKEEQHSSDKRQTNTSGDYADQNENCKELAGGHGDPPLQKAQRQQLYNVIGRMKSYTTKIYGGHLWQRSFHDHIVRNEKEYQMIATYIENNALKWKDDCFYYKAKD